ncbi:MAG TPA: hypothetical protein VF476_02445 [Chitinophagaceae bacterium]
MNNALALLILSVLVFAYFFLLHKRNSKKNRRWRNPLLRTRKKLSQEIASLIEKEIINNQLIGLDKKKKRVIFFHFGREEDGVISLSLSKIASCTIHKQAEEIVHRGRNRTTSEKELSRVSLLFYSLRKTLLFEFVFFDQDKNTINELPHLIDRAEHWETLIKKTGGIGIAAH